MRKKHWEQVTHLEQVKVIYTTQEKKENKTGLFAECNTVLNMRACVLQKDQVINCLRVVTLHGKREGNKGMGAKMEDLSSFPWGCKYAVLRGGGGERANLFRRKVKEKGVRPILPEFWRYDINNFCFGKYCTEGKGTPTLRSR